MSEVNTTHELSDLPLEMRSSEIVRMELMQVFIGASMQTVTYANYGLGERTTLTANLGDHYLRDCPAFQWIERRLLCLLIVSRLDAEDNLPVAVVKLVQELKLQMEKETIPTSMTACKAIVFFAIISSLYRVSIVRIEVIVTATHSHQQNLY
ncbi:hypothetical protein BT96DRAFT_1023031 [Gymnopus androsaceus JB14]|uniref:Uncharacterized protein n=1 Tax=Gymnopus androsaceus JB14 TaxID=1447944 RepID=A0A6A4H5U1_9AGAR|nr:hypothetical protein BT96DRAFT_1023031 [Gymnopus androsaceus JB14]